MHTASAKTGISIVAITAIIIVVISLSLRGSCPLSVYIISQVDSFVKGFFESFLFFFERAFALSLLS